MISKLHKIAQNFSIYSNQRHQVKQIIGGKEIFYDRNIDQYEPCIQAFLQKRKTKKSEIPPKIYIIEALKSIKDSLDQQHLCPLKQLYKLEQQIKTHQLQAYDSAYITSIVCEPYFKNMMDEYLQKILINGRVVPLDQLEEYNQIKNKVMKLYRTFFFGDELSPLEREIEFRYLALKQNKFFKYQQTEKNRYRSLWTYSQQRRVELLKNWRYRDPNLYDDIRPIYEPMHIEEKGKYQQMMIDINQDPFKRKMIYKFFESNYFNPKSKKYFEFVTQYLQTRTMLYINSTEFNRILSISPDFHIEHSILNMHMWMIIDRLKKIGTREANIIVKNIDYQFKRYTLDKIGKIHLKKKNDFIKDVNHFMVNNRMAFDRHFNQLYIEDPYQKIDALIWSSLFFEKVERYSDEVYLMSEYFIQNYRYIQELSFEQILDCDIQWDVFRITLDYKERILARNPQLSKEEFLNEFESDKKDKKYYYTHKLPIQEENEKVEKQNEIIQKASYSMFKTIRKYQTLDTYDFYSEKEEKEKQNKLQKEQSAWIQQDDQQVDHDEDYIKVLRLKRKREQQQKLQNSNNSQNQQQNNKQSQSQQEQ